MPIALSAIVSILVMLMADEMNSWGRKWVENGELDKAATCFNTALMLNISGIILTLTTLAFLLHAARKHLA